MFDKTLKEKEIEFETFKSNANQLKLMQAEIDRLKQENKQLKTEKAYWKSCYEVLHNNLSNEKNTDYKDSSLKDMELSENFLSCKEAEDLGYDLNEMENAYTEMEKNYRM